MPQPWGDLYRRDHILVLGTPGCGKTPFAAELVEGGRTACLFGVKRAARRVVYFDPTGEWKQHGERVSPLDLREEPALLARQFLRLVVEPTDGDLANDFHMTVNACRAAEPHGGLVLVVDEVGDLTREGGDELLRGLHRNGHKDGVATILVSPCWTDIPARCRATASRVFSFHQSRSDDIRALTAELGRQVPEFGEHAAAWRFPQPPVAWKSPTLHT